jgi:hypothetical protein
MSRWKTTFDSQKLIQKIDESLGTLDSLDTQAMPPGDLAEFGRLLKVLKQLKEQFAALDPEFSPLNLMGNWASWATNIQNNLRMYQQRRQISDFQQANQQADEILNNFRPLSGGIESENGHAFIEANTALLKKIVEDLHSKAESLKPKFETVSNAIAQFKVGLDENSKVIQQHKTRLDASIAEFQKQFSAAQEKRGTDFTTELRNIHGAVAERMTQFEAQFKLESEKRSVEAGALVEAVRQQSDANLKFIKEREADVNKIFGAIGNAAFAGNFKTTADQERRSANNLRWIALLLMGGMVVVAIYAFYYSLTHPTEWEVFAFRLGTCLILAIPAAYAANESSKHRERERLNRKVHLELASIDAYLVLLPESQRNEIKGKLSEKFFGVADMMQENASTVSQKDVFKLLTTAVGNLTKGK